jgi:hypothetical protein
MEIIKFVSTLASTRYSLAFSQSTVCSIMKKKNKTKVKNPRKISLNTCLKDELSLEIL